MAQRRQSTDGTKHRRTVRAAGRWLVVAVLCGAVGGPPECASAEVSFNHDVKPILSDRCFHCHGPDANNQASAFRLDNAASATADLGGYVGIAPGDLRASELHRRIWSEGADRMPPLDSHRSLTDAEKRILDAWIEAGAKFETHWSFEALPSSIPLPEISSGWARNEIDQFVQAAMRDQGFEPNAEASRENWLRRVTFDLTGLPPTIEEIDGFLADNTPDAYERVVDRLLSSMACAERLTTEWLDVARYADSYGYQRDDPRFVWPWRDWVIRAFHRNMPYDEFITWQLAGDLLPGATREQVLATAFNRLHSHKKEGGVAIEEFRVENVADRTHTVGAAFMGLTFECARCHDHKYDPITTKDYYRLSSFFANIDERGLISFFTDAVPTPAMPLPSEAQQAALEEAEQEIAAAERELRLVQAAAQVDFESWLPNRGPSSHMSGMVAHLPFDSLEAPQPHVTAGEQENNKATSADLSNFHGLTNTVVAQNQAHTAKTNTLVKGMHGNAIKLTGDDPVEIPNTGQFSRDQPFSVALWINTAEVSERAVIYRHSRGWDDAGSIGYELTKLGAKLSAKLSHFWPGNAICVETDEVLTAGAWYHVAVTYDGSSKAGGLRIYINGQPARRTVVQDQLTRHITQWSGGEHKLAIGSRYRDRGFKDGMVDDFFVFDRAIAALEVRQLFDRESLEKALARPIEALSTKQRAELLEFFLLAEHEPSKEARTALRKARQQWNQAMDATPAITVMREQPTPRPAFVLRRGGYDDRGERVTAGTPEFLPEFPHNQPNNRLGLARWLTSSRHPLTARVTVNRYWQMMFGTGLVRTPEDFGAQGQRPTHPQLLDWLARDFIDRGWDVHRLLRMMALSATYRQNTVVPRHVRQRDPENRYLARGASKRLSAEMIRDNVLAVSKLLSNKTGGSPVKPYDVSLSYKPSKPDQGDGLYRRSLYTFWQRTAPAPVMTTLNANKRDVCRLRREVAPSPLQALVMLNGTQFVEAARVMAANLLVECKDDDRAIIVQAFRQLTSHRPTAAQFEILSQLFQEQIETFREHPERAAQLLAVGEAPATANLAAERHAAATVLVNSIMNLDQSVRLQ